MQQLELVLNDTRTSRVFIPQVKATLNNGVWIPAVNLKPAHKFGLLVELLRPDHIPLDIQPLILNLQADLQDFCDLDYILAIGDPTLIGAVVAVASAANNGRVKMLKWDRYQKQYNEVHINLKKGNGDVVGG